jgi:hypothetical protein
MPERRPISPGVAEPWVQRLRVLWHRAADVGALGRTRDRERASFTEGKLVYGTDLRVERLMWLLVIAPCVLRPISPYCVLLRGQLLGAPARLVGLVV